ncbi:MAG TPA: hypothetical protein PKU94_03870 [Candidatus Hydrothermia bacterium]|nr:hypothetical protein [Candidatus Hydrothermae bacterium]MDD3649249.1 hypothetical protein [Candidatus Hydrothermia bacterium]MDD5573082.1 hypothetical protein [Candidatus Hydrothermia bacterium]HOK22663.1 hypothetical protein [Candidatus Hydrothermia bacterium]HOL23372.1 hypothetical protein [Candidatus Hydrothermia bacterium]
MRKSLKIEEPDYILISTLFKEIGEELRLSFVNEKEEFQSTKILNQRVGSFSCVLSSCGLNSRGKLYVISKEEIQNLKGIPPQDFESKIDAVDWSQLGGIVITEGIRGELPLLLERLSSRVPILCSDVPITNFWSTLNSYLSFKFSPFALLHGSAAEVFGEGVLITGPSGSGKSEIVLELMRRGHSFVADDLIKVISFPFGTLTLTSGTPERKFRYFLELRGAGIIDLLMTYGPGRVRDKTTLSVVVELMEGNDKSRNERGMLEKGELLQKKVNFVRLPVKEKALTVSTIETIVLTIKLRKFGFNTKSIIDSVLGGKGDKEIK